MTRIESEIHDLYECLMRNDGMADHDTYYTIVGIANNVAEVESENAKLRELSKWAVLCSEGDVRCEACPYHDNADGYVICKMRTAATELGIEVQE